MKVFWTETAVQHLSSIYSYISKNSPQYAQRLVDKLTKRSEQIATFPSSGRIVPEFDTKQIREVTADSGSVWHAEKGCNLYSVVILLSHMDAETAVLKDLIGSFITLSLIKLMFLLYLILPNRLTL